MQAMLYAIDKINNDTSILPNITLGATIYDSCRSQTIGAKMTKELITLTLVPSDDGELVGVIGPHSSDLSKVVADFLRVFKIPQISYGATANLLSDKSIYSYFFRTVPPDVWQAQAMADIVLELGWNYVITINSNSLYSEKGIEEFHKAAKDRGICIAMIRALRAFPSKNDFDDLVGKLNLEPTARGVVLFTDQRDSRSILKALKRNPASKTFYWLASDSWGNNLDVAEGVEGYAEGAITVTQLNEPVPGFVKYFKSMNPAKDVRLRNNSWFQDFWQSHFNCLLDGSLDGSFKNFSEACSGNESLSGSSLTFAPIRTVVNAVYAMAHALNDSIKARCTVMNGSCNALKSFNRESLVGYLKNATFKDQATGEKLSFNKQQEILGSYSIFNFQKSGKYKRVGVWEGPSASYPHGNLNLNTSDLLWPNKSSTPPVSRCSPECARGQVRERKDNHNISCCWNCVTCGSRDYIVNNTCLRCAYGYSPDANLTTCMKLRIVRVMSKASSKAIIAISVLGLISVIIVSVIFFKHSHVPLIKASSRELSGIILFGLALLFIFPWFLLAEPSRAVCVCQPLILGVALASCYAPLFMKILRIFRIFNSARKSASKPILVSPASQVLIAVSLIMIQFFFATTAFFPTMPVPVERESGDARKIFVECSIEKEVFASLLSYNMLLMALCTIVAFKTRKFPRNFNEAKYIGFTMYFTCFVWIIFFPFYLSSGSGLKRINWEASAVLFIGWITLIGLFAPKIALLYLGGQVSNKDQLAVTNNTVSEAAVVRVDCPKTPSDGRRNAVEKGDQDKPESSSADVLE